MSPPAVSNAFLPFLLQDAAGLGDKDSEEVVEILNDALAHLLSQPAEGFWRVLRTDASLAECLDTYLQFSRKPGDACADVVVDESLARQQLSRRVFCVLMRMVTVEAGGPGAEEQARIIYDRWLLDTAKLLDVAALYGPDNPALVHRFFWQVFELQPRYVTDLAATGPLLAQNLEQVHLTTLAAVQRAAGGDATSLAAVQDGGAYLHDSFRTLAALATAFPPLAGVLLTWQARDLMTLLPAVHDQLLPQLHSLRQSQHIVGPLRVALQRLVNALLRGAYLIDPDLPPGWPQNPKPTPQARGEKLVSAIVAVGESGTNILDSAAADQSLIKSANRRYRLEEAVREAEVQGIIALDASQRDYAITILRSHGSAYRSSLANGGGAGASGRGSYASGSGHANGHATHVANGHGDGAVLGGLIRQVRDVLPDYGEGFVAACLARFGNDPEQVVHSLLEGSLPADLASWEASRPLPPASSAASIPSSSSGAVTGEMSWLSLAEGSEATLARQTLRRPEPNQAAPNLAPAARLGRGVTRFLEERGPATEAVRLYASASQWEYDDEYDDSFDDLAGGTADGLCEAEGDDAEASTTDRASNFGNARAAGPSGAGGGGRGGKTRQWVLDGRIYNYKKEGAVEVHSAAEATRAVYATRAAAQAIHGLGAGGNKSVAPVPRDEDRPRAGPEGQGEGSERGEGHGGRGGGRGPGPPGGGGGRGRVSFAHKDKNKAAIGNHHRKDRALRKFAGPPAG